MPLDEALAARVRAHHLHEISHLQLVRATDDFATVLGRGAFATVYKGVMSGSGETVAVKVDSPGLANKDEKTSQLLEQQYVYEIEILYGNAHPNICALIAHCTDGPTRSLVYEYCSNGNLLDRIAAAKKEYVWPVLTWPERLRIAVGTARGLAFLHSSSPNAIVHRDVKVVFYFLSAVFFFFSHFSRAHRP
jgi:serine/threonine protein kinase